jgi:transcriptional regulator with XRE-family HTH domain
MGIGEALRSLRKDMRISREELEMLSGVSVATIKRLESGCESVALGNVLAIAAALRARVEVRSGQHGGSAGHAE